MVFGGFYGGLKVSFLRVERRPLLGSGVNGMTAVGLVAYLVVRSVAGWSKFCPRDLVVPRMWTVVFRRVSA